MSPLAVSVKQAAELLNIGPQAIYAAVNAGDLPAKRMPGKKAGTPGSAIRIDVEQLRAWFGSLDNVRDIA